MVLGSAHIFDDTYLTRDDNALLCTALFRMLCEAQSSAAPSASSASSSAAAHAGAGGAAGGSGLVVGGVRVESVDEDRPEYAERTEIPDIEALAGRLVASKCEGDVCLVLV
jgi:hypothetical protein